jgi:hypothetical protein
MIRKKRGTDVLGIILLEQQGIDYPENSMWLTQLDTMCACNSLFFLA